MHHCTDRCLSKNIDKKVTLIWPLLPVQTGSQSWISKKKSYFNNHKRYISYFWTIVQIVNCQKIFTKKWPNLTFNSCPNRKSKFNIYKNHISTTARGKFTIFTPLYRSLIVKKYLPKSDPIWPLIPVQTGSQSLLLQKIISQQPQEVNSQFVHYCTDR